jgi:hypothetical protein
VTHALGADPAIAPDVAALPSDGLMLLCTPALPRLLTDAEIAAALEPHDELAAGRPAPARPRTRAAAPPPVRRRDS